MNENFNHSAVDHDLTIRAFFLMLRRRRSTLLWTVSVCLLLAVTLCLFLKPRYRSLGEIQVQKSSTDELGLETLTGPKPISSDALEENLDLETQANILESYSLALKVIDDLNLEQTPDFKQSFDPIDWTVDQLTPNTSIDASGAALDDAPRRRDHAVKLFEKHLKIKPQSGTRLIDIQYTSTDPRIAAAVVNDIAKSLVDYTLNSRVVATSQVSKWLAGQLGDIKKDAEEQQGKLERLQKDSGVYSLGIPDAQGKEIAYSATLDRLQQATQELSSATSNRILKGALYKTIENGDPELLSGLAGSTLVGASPAVNNSFLLLQNLRTQQASLSSQIASDKSKYGVDNPKLADDKAGLDSINSAIAAEVARIGERAANDYKAAQVTEASTRSVYEQIRKSADELNDKAIALLIARQEATDARSLYQTLSTHLKEAGVIEGLRSSNVSVVDVGRIPSKPVPYVLIIPALSLVVGCVLGVIVALLAESMSNRVERIASLEDTLRTPILAILPEFRVTRSSRTAMRIASKNSSYGKITSLSSDTRIAVLENPNTAYAEALRGLRTSLLNHHGKEFFKRLLITSAVEQEGKSTLSLNLAAALALNGARVLLIDADLRRAGLTGYIGGMVDGSDVSQIALLGLSDVLSGADKEAIINPFPELPALSVLPAGKESKYPNELLGSNRMRTLLDSWSATYQYILIDTPPVLAVADAIILSQLTDMTLLLTRFGESTQKSLERAYLTLRESEAGDIGIIVNAVPRASVSYSEFYGYSGNTYYTEARL